MATSERITFDVYFDYLCPYVYRLAKLLEAVRESGRRDFEVGWRFFSLTQVNSKDDGWAVWSAPASEKVRGRLAFQAAEAARRQGRFADLHQALLAARHRDRLDVDDPEIVAGVAARVGLDGRRFRADVADPSTLEPLAHDHGEGVREHGVFGTPTLVFAGGASAYVRLGEAAAADEAVGVFDRLLAVAAAEPRILEIKRPRRPGALGAPGVSSTAEY